MIYQDLIKKIAAKHNLNPNLVAAVIEKESSFNTDATRFEADWNAEAKQFEDVYRWLYKPEKFSGPLGISVETEISQQATSWGLMQVMGAVAREAGYTGPMHRLCRPDFGVEYGCLHLAKYMKRYGNTEQALAAYNGGPGAVRGDGAVDPDRWRLYVKPVMESYMRGGLV